MTNAAQHIIDTYTSARLRPRLIMFVLSNEVSGSGNLAFTHRHCRNHIAKSRQKRFEKGYIQLVLEYFRNMQFENPVFFYAMQVEENGHLTRIFWADARSRMNYQFFDDVVVFDTTYLTNKYRMPFVPLTGVNHHHQSMLFGCNLLVDEIEESFVWLFKKWLQAMSGHHPTSIITDQDLATGAAIRRVFANTYHHLFLWHILKKVPEKLSHVYAEYGKSFSDDFHKCIHNFETIHEFESQMSTTQRSESMNLFFDGYVNAKSTQKEFIENYALASDSRNIEYVVIEEENDGEIIVFKVSKYDKEKREAMYVLDEGLKIVAIVQENIDETHQQGSPKDFEVLQLNVNEVALLVIS
ncbi:protein FAR1-RELATED SEQUENCE 5-like [Amborella trichopoda]|uniref:protein FAR1-RELATED SEQUENCE 5-like n=1 Tax=Amborella trichopoda TaxID=13333 RepID=UPI0009BFE0E9|nr:protein FAR1-RELATED SEQUENCE 5-like [Amborella trichopoda]|eukprot:XP_020525867.1 protein FAR1-RELATED SEQUENCE 5-like [Amborella trichopoda]